MPSPRVYRKDDRNKLPPQQRLSRELPAVGHGDRCNDYPQPSSQDEEPVQESHPCCHRYKDGSRAAEAVRFEPCDLSAETIEQDTRS